MATRVLLLTQWFDPEPTFKGLLFARELVHQGFEVEVVTGFPNYPSGTLYPGYRVKWLQREMINGVRVTRLPLYPNHDQSPIKRVFNYVSFAASSSIYGLFMARRADVIYAYHPPLTVGVTAVLIRLLRRIPVVYDIQDMWPDTLCATRMITNPKALRVVSAVCRWVYRHVDHIAVLSPGFKRLLIERGVSDHKLSVIYNWADETALTSSRGMDNLPPALSDASRFRILFAGNIGKAQALDAVLDAAAQLQDRNVPIRWIMLGDGVEAPRLRQRAADMKLRNVVFLSAVPMADVGRYLEAADALLVHLRKDPLFAITIPSKTQAYMAVGRPLLMAVDGDAADLVRQSNSGMIAEAENPDSIASVAESMANTPQQALLEMATNAKRFYVDHLAVRVGVEGFAKIFNKLAKRSI